MIIFSTLEELNWYLEKQPIGTIFQITKAKTHTCTVYEVVTKAAPITDTKCIRDEMGWIW